jgi:hypothetical protein
MYKNKLFAFGAKQLMKNKGSLKLNKKKSSQKTGGALNNLDNYLLSLIGGVRQMSVKPKSKSSKSRSSGGALKFIR